MLSFSPPEAMHTKNWRTVVINLEGGSLGIYLMIAM
jgi:hypothetical protein